MECEWVGVVNKQDGLLSDMDTIWMPFAEL